MDERNLAIIPARGGSKRIPRKNLRSFCGQPILSYPLAAARASDCFTEIMVSTDDEEIADLATRLGARIPFMRSSATATDLATTSAVLTEVLNGYRERGEPFDLACCIYPTAAFLTADQIWKGLALLRSDPALTMVFAAQAYPHPVQRALRIRDSKAEFMWPENSSVRTQDLEPLYHDTGVFYWFRPAKFLEQGSLWGKDVGALIVESDEAHDLDVNSDWMVAEAKYAARQQTQKHYGN